MYYAKTDDYQCCMMHNKEEIPVMLAFNPTKVDNNCMSNTQFGIPEEYRDVLSPEQTEEYIDAARKYYTYDLPYHNWDHAMDVVAGIDRIADKLEAQGVFIGRNALKIAAAWHDAGFHEDSSEDFRTKEEYSSHLLDRYLVRKPVPDAVKMMLMHHPIVSTVHMYPKQRMPAQMILHRADVANIGGPADGFLEANRKIWQEAGGITKEGWLRHVNQTLKFVEFTAIEHDYESLIRQLEITDTSVDVHDELFSVAARRNAVALSFITDPTQQI